MRRGDLRKSNFSETIRKVTEMMEIMKQHEAAHLFNQPLDANHHMYKEIKDTYTTLSMIDLHFKIGDKYKTTDEIAAEFRKMIMTKFKMSMHEPTEYPLIQSFNIQFDKEFAGLEGQSLIKGQEPPPVKQALPKNAEVPKPKPSVQKQPKVVEEKKKSVPKKSNADEAMTNIPSANQVMGHG